MSNMVYKKLGELVFFENGDRSDKYPKQTDFVEYGIPFIKGGDIENNAVNDKTIDYITKSKFRELRAGKAKKDDILLSLRGSLSKCVRSPFQDAQIASALVIVRPTPEITNDYLYYFLSSEYFRTLCRNYNNGSVQANLSVAIIQEFLVPLPSIRVQKNIIEVLNDLDLKIKNNNKISFELERLAKTIYDYWFLQFEFPNEEGKPYKSSGGKMAYNEELKREIPEGWGVKPVKDCIKHINTGLNPRDHFVLNDKREVKYITVKNLTTSGTLDFSGCDFISFKTKELVNKRSQIQKGDILFASIAPLGRCYLIEETPKDWEINESVFSIRPDSDTISAEYLYMFFMSNWFIKKAEHSSTGSVFSGIRVSVLEDTKILVPDEATTKRFSEKVSSIMNMKFNKEKENHQLVFLRDWLLPMLMNGQVSFKEKA